MARRFIDNARVSPLLVVLALLAIVLTASATHAQVSTTQSAVNFGSVAVGASTGSAHAQSLSFTVPSGLTLGGISAVTQGAQNLDFTVVPGGTTCAIGTTNTTCAVLVQFLPKAVGARLGAVVLTDQSTPAPNTLITVPLYGTGTGPLVAFGPGTITTVAGNGTTGSSGDNGAATSAELDGPAGVALDGTGNLYIAESGPTFLGNDVVGVGGNRIREVTPGGTITTVAGNGTAGYGGDGGPATSAEVYGPAAVALDGAGNLYIADFNNNLIRKVTPGGTITTVAGTVAGAGTGSNFGYSGDGGPATSAELFSPSGVALDGAGNLYIADKENNLIRKVTPGGTITTVAGTVAGAGTGSNFGYSGDGGPATSAKLYQPAGIAVDAEGNLYIADEENNLIRKVTPSGTITTVAGTVAGAGTGSNFGYSGDGGPATSAELFSPSGVALDGAGNLYIVDQANNLIRMVDAATGVITTVAGNVVGAGTGSNSGYSGDGGPATNAELNSPFGISLDGSGNLYIADLFNSRVRKVDVSAPLLPLNFASTEVGAASASQDVTVLNLGNAPLTFSSISAAPNFTLGGADTSCSTTTPLTLAASCILGIEFAPQAVGSISGSVILTDNSLNASAAQQTINLQGTGLLGTQGTVTVTVETSSGTPTTTVAYGEAGLKAVGSGGGGTGAYSYSAGASTACTVDPNSGALTITSGTGTCFITATRAGDTDYNPSTPSTPFTVTVSPQTPVLNWAPPAAAITYGTALSGTQLDATCTATVNGAPVTFVPSYILGAGAVEGGLNPQSAVGQPASGAVLNAAIGIMLQASCSPTPTTDYNTPTPVTVPITVNKATPVIPWSNPAAITYGTVLNGTQLDATQPSWTVGTTSGPVLGTITYTLGAGAMVGFPPISESGQQVYPSPTPTQASAQVLDAASSITLHASYAVTDTTDYNTPLLTTVNLIVKQATPVITWLNPAAITYGTPLSGTQLDATFGWTVNGATVSVAGSPIYNPLALTELGAGSNQPLSVNFTPTDNVDYSSANGAASITVNQAPTASVISVQVVPTAAGLTFSLSGAVAGPNAVANCPFTIPPATASSQLCTAPTGNVTFYDGSNPLPPSLTLGPQSQLPAYANYATETGVTSTLTPPATGSFVLHTVSLEYPLGNINYLPTGATASAGPPPLGPIPTVIALAAPVSVVAGSSFSYPGSSDSVFSVPSQTWATAGSPVTLECLVLDATNNVATTIPCTLTANGQPITNSVPTGTSVTATAAVSAQSTTSSSYLKRFPPVFAIFGLPAFGFLFIALPGAGGFRRRKVLAWLGLTLAVITFMGLIGCGAGFHNSVPIQQGNGTVPGTYYVVVSGTYQTVTSVNNVQTTGQATTAILVIPTNVQ